MDDDIDIEEHDVMDNPRIKSMFPDLSCVKLEIPDEEDIDEQYGILQPEEEHQEMQYQYDYGFETTTGETQENTVSQENEYYGEEEEDTSYFYNNEIILDMARPLPLQHADFSPPANDFDANSIHQRNTQHYSLKDLECVDQSNGSKPPLDLNLLYEEALHSHPIVYLEDWEQRLKSSPCFCETCEILFPTVNALDAHKMISHSYLVAMDSPPKNTARKSTSTSKYCNHCSKTFPDDTSLIKHLYELLPLNNFPKVKEEVPESKVTKPQVLPWPKKVKSTSQMITKIHPKKDPKDVKIEDLKAKLKTKLTRDANYFALVPKSTLFQCNVCQICFISCFSTLKHTKLCRKVLASRKCEVCKRKIRNKDVKIHELQHSYNDKLKIYTTHKSIYERVLCKCPKCLSCFDELAFWAHYQNCKKSVKNSLRCPDCDINIALSRFKWHRQKHTSKKLTKKDFIIIEFHDQNAIKTSENRVEITAERKKQIQSLYKEKRRQKMLESDANSNEITLYYCDICGCCQYILNYKGHSEGVCNVNNAAKKFCEKCGLCFTPKSYSSHLVLHEKKTFSLKDITIISLRTGKSIDPPMPEFLECDKCFKNFLEARPLHIHNCKTEKSVTCKICTKKFNIQAYKIHKIFHSVDKLMPELMKKYNSLNSTWNIMFMCLSCELVTMTYDSAVTHAQGHLNYIISDFHKQCLICDLKIAEKEFHLHEKLHTDNDEIVRESFKILKYEYENLFKKEWLQLFKELPKELRQHILSKSIYRFTRSVKMQIEITAPTDDTKYFCMNCNHFIEGPQIRQHIVTKCSRNTKLVCKICHEIFKSLKLFFSHEGSHEKTPKRQTIVSFNNECDKEFNNHLCLVESKSKKSTNEIPSSKLRELLTTDTTKAIYKLYKCAQCEACMTLKSSCRRHRCVTGNDRYYCDICEQFFCVKQKAIHINAHRKKPYVNKDSFHVIYFNGGPNSKSTWKKNEHWKSYKRDATGKFIRKKDVKNSAKKFATPKISLKKDVTPKFSTKKEVTPKISPKNEVTPKNSPKKDVTPKISPKKIVISKIFQCTCGLHFTSLKTVEKHLDQCSPDVEVSKEMCSKCNLVFPTEVLVTHLINHHHKETKIVIEKVAKSNIFKCPICAVFFTNMDFYNSHTNHCDPKNGSNCKNCLLTFGKKCFNTHLCSSEDTTYINKITIVKKKTVKESTVYKCITCDVCYLKKESIKYHVAEARHSLKNDPNTCETCGLRFTNYSFKNHCTIHSFPAEDFRIKVIDPYTDTVEFVTGTNKDGNTESKSPRKRRGDNVEEQSASVKKAKENPVELDTSLRKSHRRVLDRASTSRNSDIINDSSEMIVTDEISIQTAENTSEMDDSLDKNGLSNRLKSRILVKGYSNKLYKCVYCLQHFLKEASFDSHAKVHKLQDACDNHKCDICGLDFSRYTLPRHKYVHHDNMGLTKDDFVILTETVHSKEIEILQRIKSLNPTEADLKRIKTLMGENETEDTVSDTETGSYSEPKLSDVSDTNLLSDVNQLSDLNDISDANTLSEVNISDISNTNTLSEINVSDVSVNPISDVNINKDSETDSLSGDKVSEIDTNNETKVSDTEKIFYYKCSDCNVCYIDERMCLEHSLKHEILDPKTYIQCKICDFQFLIDSLKEHMILHHSADFRIETLTIHEYKTSGTGLDPKIDIYQAVDKLQSKLVSTTTDVGIV